MSTHTRPCAPACACAYTRALQESCQLFHMQESCQQKFMQGACQLDRMQESCQLFCIHDPCQEKCMQGLRQQFRIHDPCQRETPCNTHARKLISTIHAKRQAMQGVCQDPRQENKKPHAVVLAWGLLTRGRGFG